MKAALALLLLALLLLAIGGALQAAEDAPRRMIVLGVDGMDPVLLRTLIDEGATPNLARLARMGGFETLGTSVPPQSPVAWSNFITGMDPGGHGLFDFIALDRQTLLPYLSSARVEPSSMGALSVGPWRLPLGADSTESLRDGRAFWELLQAEGIPATIFQVPANYPPLEAGEAALSGMGTPDLRGTPGTFSYFTDAPSVAAGDVSGGVVERVQMLDHRFASQLLGPPNALRVDGAPSAMSFSVHTDAVNPVALIQMGEERRLLKVGEWSDWITVSFPLIPGLVEVPGMVRVYLQSLSPHFALYVSPVNIDPRDPALPISYPAAYATQLAEAGGPFYTQEMPEDTKALSAHVLSATEFVAQTELVMDERRRLLRSELERFRTHGGDRFLFYYLSTIDQRNHMLARQAEQSPPDAADAPLADVMRRSYIDVDEMVGWILDGLDPHTAFIVMSDHGFAPFRKGANLNTWLERHGYLKLKDPSRRGSDDWLSGIDWKRTRAFGLGLNALYLNVRGRERDGIVEPESRERLAREIARRLGDWRDPETGEHVVTQPLLREDVYTGKHLAQAPDIIVGYARGYRASWGSSTGRVPAGLLEVNDEEWSGDHCMDAREVPGVLLANRAIKAGGDLRDLPVTILNHFGVKPPAEMAGRSLW